MPENHIQSANGARITQPAQTNTHPCVLVADDDDDIREALRVVLEDEGYVVLEASDGVETIAVMLNAEPLVVLLDVIMPRMSGFEVLMRALNDEDLRTRHAYIVLTAERMSSSRIGPRFSELVTQHQIPVVGKPFQLDDLLNAVAEQSRRLMTPASKRRDARDTTGA